MHATADATQTLLARLADARQMTDDLFRIVKSDSLYERPIPERHRIIFYIGHLEAFDWNLISERLLGLKPFDPDFDRLFAFGIDPVGGGLPTDQPSDWPAVSRVEEYCRQVRQKIDQALERFEETAAQREDAESNFRTLLNVAIEHRLMHAETLAYMFHQLPLAHKIHAEGRPGRMVGPLVANMILIPTGGIALGLQSRDGDEFGWDNEFQFHTVSVPAFEIDRYEVTNGQFLEFIAAGGYENRSLWTEEGWNWIRAADITHPAFWKKNGSGWVYRGMFDEIQLPLDGPVLVSHAEATAYARWAGKELPTEAQWQRAAYGTPGGDEREFPWGSDAPDHARGNFDFFRWDPEAVNAHPEGQSAFGVADMAGNCWEWTSTVFEPFQGFKPFAFYPGYSANFFDGEHYVLKGGSARTAACMLRKSFRNWFQAHYQYVYAGFRCAKNQS